MNVKTSPIVEEPVTVYEFTFLAGQFTVVLYDGIDTVVATDAAYVFTQPASAKTQRTSEEVTTIHRNASLLWHVVRHTTVKRLYEQPLEETEAPESPTTTESVVVTPVGPVAPQPSAPPPSPAPTRRVETHTRSRRRPTRS